MSPSQGDANRSYSDDDRSSYNFEESERQKDTLHLPGSECLQGLYTAVSPCQRQQQSCLNAPCLRVVQLELSSMQFLDLISSLVSVTLS